MQKSNEATKGGRRKAPRSIPRQKLPVRWIDLPHEELYQRALNSMLPGSPKRAGEDSLKFILKRRLRDLDRGDHSRYVEIESHHIVEALRLIRDEYRGHLEKEGCKPIAEMYWVVFRFAVVQYAVRLLREAASEYVVNSRVPFGEWELLYGRCILPRFPGGSDSSPPASLETPSPESVTDVMRALVREETFEQVLVGGPFGREGQMFLTRRYPSFDFWGPGVDFSEIMKRCQVLWEKCKPWTDGLAGLFDSTQEELNFQHSLLDEDAKRVESAFIKLSAFEKIAYEYLVAMRRSTVNPQNLEEPDWLQVLEALDRNGVALEDALTDTPKRVLEAVRLRRHQITTWKECYRSKLCVTMDDGKTHSLRREVTHAVHNAAKKAAYQLAKVWGGTNDPGA